MDFKYYEVADLRLRTSRITKLRTCGCGLQELRSCGLAVADSRILKRRCGLAVADLWLRTKLLNVQLRACGCGLRKLKFGCGFADCGLKKKLAVPSTDDWSTLDIPIDFALSSRLSTCCINNTGQQFVFLHFLLHDFFLTDSV